MPHALVSGGGQRLQNSILSLLSLRWMVITLEVSVATDLPADTWGSLKKKLNDFLFSSIFSNFVDVEPQEHIL